MSLNLFWLQLGACGGDTMSLLSAESPDILELFGQLDVNPLWHPSLSAPSPKERRQTVEAIVNGEVPLDVLVVEGSVIRGPGGTGMYDVSDGRPKKDLLAALANMAGYVVAVGTCACYGGVADPSVEPTGLQFQREARGGFLGPDFKSLAGLPVVNLPGCPCHTDIMAGALSALASGVALNLDEYQRPVNWYGMMVHQGCTRNEYHEYRVEENDFGEKGCLFFYKGCRGPLTHGPCNKLLWNGRTSKTRIGAPCFGCTEPNFPQPYPFFKTRNIEGIPIELPSGLNRAHYMAYKGMAAAAAPDRLKDRKTHI